MFILITNQLEPWKGYPHTRKLSHKPRPKNMKDEKKNMYKCLGDGLCVAFFKGLRSSVA